MPISGYYKGEGSQVMASMKKRYGEKAGKRVFYATANARGLNPTGAKKKKRKTVDLMSRAMGR